MIPSSYTVQKISAKIAKEYIHKNHYSKGSHNGPSPNYGLFDNGNLIGVLMFSTPCSENVRSSLFGPAYKDAVIELHRLHILDVTPKNTETWFIAKCIKLLKIDRPETLGIISFADPTENHSGIIYKASNFLKCGKSSKAMFYKDKDGRLRHPRQCGVSITRKMAKERGWEECPREGKHRFIYLLNKKAKQLFKLWEIVETNNV